MRLTRSLVRGWPLLLALAATTSPAQMAQTCARQAAPAPARAVSLPAAVPLLQQRRDLRSLALADYLHAASGAAGGEEARARLQDRARAATDPLLTVLALHMPCTQRGCRNIEGSQWSRLEPDNLLAWLALPTRSSADTGYVLQQVAAQARQVRSYRQEVNALLADLPPSGLGLRQPWGLLNLTVLGAACRDPQDDTTAQRCEAIAEGLWSEGGAMERHLAAALAVQVLQRLPERRGAWASRVGAYDGLLRAGPPPGGELATTEEVCRALGLLQDGERSALSDVDRARILARLTGLSVRDARPSRRGLVMRQPP